MTPNSSAPPEATSPGRIVSMSHCRSPAIATSPGITARTASPRRSGTERQIPARSVRTSATRSEPGCGRDACAEVSSRSSSRAGFRLT